MKKKKYFRIAVQGGGCSGYKYNFSFDNKLEKDDILFDLTIIDKASLEIISGSTVDFKKEMIEGLLRLIILKRHLRVVAVYLSLLNENNLLEC